MIDGGNRRRLLNKSIVVSRVDRASSGSRIHHRTNRGTVTRARGRIWAFRSSKSAQVFGASLVKEARFMHIILQSGKVGSRKLQITILCGKGIYLYW